MAGENVQIGKTWASFISWMNRLWNTDKSTGAELNAGVNDTNYATAKALKDGEYVGIHVGTTPPDDTTKLWLDTN